MIVTLVVVAAVVVLALTAAVAWREHRHFVDAEESRRRDDELHRRQEDEVVESETRLRLSLDAITQGVVMADPDGNVLYRNPYAQPFIEARHGEALVEAAVAELLAEAARGRAVEREVELFGPPRQCLFVSAMPLRFEGRDYGSVALIDDITEPQRLDAMRRDFVANISHELRTPMGALSLLAETLAGETDPDVVSRLAVRVQAEAIRLSDIMDDLLELSRIESNEASEQAPVAIQHVISEALARVKPSAEDKEVPIETVLPALDLVVRADRRQLTSAVFNLLDNAVKYSEANQPVRVTTRMEGDWVKVEVRDQGYGIPQGHQERIFERFYQVDRSRGRSDGGVGLGLAIVRHVATNHGGEVRVESAVGEGSAFTLALPVSDDEPVEQEDSQDLQPIGVQA
ncbi:MAG: HAMP domain-containing histidine kinase [Acidimicrobiia bacterium]|nr:HAMP domain-containing histidine kinase [Acidimicrobiia bacterium]MCY4432197.1 ATP-binding protein [bacterium]